MKSDSTALILRLKNGERLLGYAAVDAINETVRRVQTEVREDLDEKFTLRKAEFVKRQAAIIKPFASAAQGRPFAEIGVGHKDRLLLSIFERGGERKPFTPGAKSVAIPIKGSPARPTFKDPVPPELTFKALRFSRTRGLASLGTTKSGRSRRTKKKTSGIFFGQQGTYLIPTVGVFQRKAGTRSRRMLYSFKKNVRLKAQLKFVVTAQRHGAEWLHDAMERQVIKAIGRARGAGL